MLGFDDVHARRTTRRLVVLGLVLLAEACGGGSAPPPPTTAVSSRRAQPVAAEDRLYQDDRAELGRERVVITNRDDLGIWWTQATAAASDPKPPMPEVSFGTHMILLVSAGRSNAGDQIRVDSVGFEIQPNPTGGTSTVPFAVVRTIPDCNPFPGASFPLEIVRMPVGDPGIDWIELTEECQ